MVNRESIIKMHPLQFRKENEEETMVGRSDIGDFIIVPNIAIEIIELLDSGKNITEVEQIIERKTGTYVDVLSFADTLTNEYKFVHMLDGKETNPKVVKKVYSSKITKEIGRLFFNPVTYFIYFILIVSSLYLIASNSQYRPNITDLFMFDSITYSILILFITRILFGYLHEIGHLLAARANGINSHIQLSHRMFFLTFETDMSSIFLVDPQKRYVPFLAGIIWDLNVMAIGTWVLFMQEVGFIPHSVLLISIIKIINISIIFGLIFQFLFFMNTDLYYVFTTFLNCKNLIHNTHIYFHQFYRELKSKEKEEWKNIYAHEKKVTKWFAWFYIFGVIFIIWFVLFQIKIVVNIVLIEFQQFLVSPLWSMDFFNGILLIFLLVIPFGALIWSWNRSFFVRKQKM
jgi:hypothetical protein